MGWNGRIDFQCEQLSFASDFKFLQMDRQSTKHGVTAAMTTENP
jgi:hypothetical protein